jgi:hypothetical protein
MRLNPGGAAERNQPTIDSDPARNHHVRASRRAQNSRHTLVALLTAVLVVVATPAFADATLFIGGTTTPSTRQVKGFAVGAGLLIVGFEFEYANTSEDLVEAAPGVRTFMGNVLLQTPIAVMGLQPYFTTGGGGYRETLDTVRETHFGVNTGGGVKVSLLGPLRARVDYRVFKLRGSPLHDVVHRFYVGANLKF